MRRSTTNARTQSNVRRLVVAGFVLAVVAIFMLALSPRESGVRTQSGQGAGFFEVQRASKPAVSLVDANGEPLVPQKYFQPPPPPTKALKAPPPRVGDGAVPKPRIDKITKIDSNAPAQDGNANRDASALAVGAPAPNDPRCFVYNQVPNRCAPLWVIIGALKTGTTSVYSYLAKHPEVVVLGPMSEEDPSNSDLDAGAKQVVQDRAQRTIRYKETGFFGQFSSARNKNIAQYFKYFPEIGPGDGLVTGEGSVGYIFNAKVPATVAEWLPAARYIALLRNPVERVFSRIQHTSKLHFSTAGEERRIKSQFDIGSTEAALRFAIGVVDIIAEPHAKFTHDCLAAYDVSLNYKALEECWRTGNRNSGQGLRERARAAFSTEPLLRVAESLIEALAQARPVEQSVYYPQIGNWLASIPREQLLVVRSEDLFASPAATMAEVAAHVGLQPIDWDPICGTKYNVLRDKDGVVTLVPEKPTVAAPYPLTPNSRRILEDLYEEPNRKLEELLGRSFGWNRADAPTEREGNSGRA